MGAFAPIILVELVDIKPVEESDKQVSDVNELVTLRLIPDVQQMAYEAREGAELLLAILRQTRHAILAEIIGRPRYDIVHLHNEAMVVGVSVVPVGGIPHNLNKLGVNHVLANAGNQIDEKIMLSHTVLQCVVML
jgi:hypothetical protein